MITIANALHCLRLPYNILILAAGHYKQTQKNYIIAAVLNIIISIITVKKYGLAGVAIGTLCAMVYQTIWMALYDSKNILYISNISFIKHLFVDISIFLVSYAVTARISFPLINYFSWIKLACVVTVLWISISVCFNYIAYKEYIYKIIIGIICQTPRHFCRQSIKRDEVRDRDH